MAVLTTRVDPNSDEARANSAAMQALVEELRAKTAAVSERGAAGDDRSIARHRERGKLPVRERIDRLIDPGSAFLELIRTRGQRHVRRRGARRGHGHRHRPGERHGRGDRRQRRDGEGWHVLPDDRQKASPRPGDRAPEPTAVHLPRRQRRRVPAAPGRGLPRPRALRPHLLQPGAHVGRGHHPGRAGDGQQHRRRRVRAGDERRDGHRPRHGHDLSRRSATGEGGNRRGGERGGSGRRERPRAHQRRRRPRGAGRRARAGDRA